MNQKQWKESVKSGVNIGYWKEILCHVNLLNELKFESEDFKNGRENIPT